MNSKDRTAGEKAVLIINIFVAGLCSIIYELLISTTSSYFLGDSIKQFSITIGIYLAAMGLGSYLSRLLGGQLILRFIEVEVLLSLVGGCSVPILYFVFANSTYAHFNLVMILMITLIGLLTGLEVPLLSRILTKHYPLKINLSNVLSLDYIGGLIATLLFPFILLPWLGVYHSSLIFGLVNLSLGVINLRVFRELLDGPKKRKYWLGVILAITFLAGMLLTAGQLLRAWSDTFYRDRIIFTKTTPYQHLVLTKGGDDLRLYINRVIQFSSTDEYRYHEPLVHPAMSRANYRKKVLILGGGEGLTAREVLKYPEVEQVIIVDIDPEVFRIARSNEQLRELNRESLFDPRVETVAEDAFVFLRQYEELFDVIIADLPDPTSESLARLYSQEFYALARRRLVPNGVFVTQAASPYHTTNAFWCIAASLEAAGFTEVLPYHTYVPSFGDWGFVLAANRSLRESVRIEVPCRFLSDSTARRLTYFEKDLIPGSAIDTNTLDQPRLLDYYLEDWRRWSREGNQAQ
ncbi:polyamine aminopropyltransferase [Flavilitoribacter nigricans]|uniref:Polyamine aminopropyltransferase n=1 Tax=Flavilitoribacter nigricans (strain ATCC 23147 / DSM 23189 / NBRC 102662 / NCIMB 1420 / SS-2) TaxID=1122177 RepID=A0A2D0N1B8_FLAN2|nr:polyamine aminopropyltransferase [Flavilitoribacter nigricans]PHN02295.1 spermidine synthase [Flavilitoribacter nigricans DSM 23189 = NBRC 102662]